MFSGLSRRKLFVFASWIPIGIFVTDHVASIATVDGRSMQPTLNPDSSKLRKDVVLLDKTVTTKHDYKRGDIVALSHPTQPNVRIIKRIVALQGDLVRTMSPYPKKLVRIPDGHCWIEGDEPFHSQDSNHFGPIPLALVNARVSYILYPFRRIGGIPHKELAPGRVVPKQTHEE